MATEPKYRLAEQTAHCRVCDKSIQRKVDYMVSWYSFRNRGQNIHICPDCVKVIYHLLPEEVKNEKNTNRL